MRYKPKSIAALHIALGGLPDKMRVEVDRSIGVSARTIGELRKVTNTTRTSGGFRLRERPRSRRAAERQDELAPFQLIELHSFPASQGRIVGYRIGEDQSGW
jgi:hypothetical protein